MSTVKYSRRGRFWNSCTCANTNFRPSTNSTMRATESLASRNNCTAGSSSASRDTMNSSATMT